MGTTCAHRCSACERAVPILSSLEGINLDAARTSIHRTDLAYDLRKRSNEGGHNRSRAVPPPPLAASSGTNQEVLRFNASQDLGQEALCAGLLRIGQYLAGLP
jgi:hypothetical protein